MLPVRDEVLRVIAVLSRNSGSEQPLLRTYCRGFASDGSRTAVTEPIPCFDHQSTKLEGDTLLGVTLEMEPRQPTHVGFS
jgi:hypothetical protein